MLLKIGTRKSPLALAQSEMVAASLRAAWPGLETELVPMSTSGDNAASQPLSEIGGKGLFTKEIEEALLDNRVEIAVHSMKDMPTLLPNGLIIGAMPQREDPRDMLVGHGLKTLADLRHGATVGTSSLRRSTQMLIKRPDLNIVPMRGNVQTRLAKLERSEMRATLLAVAGLNRLGLKNIPGFILSTDDFIPAIAQGALGIECRENDSKIRELLTPLKHVPTETAVICERAFLRVLDGSCRTPIAGYATIAPLPLGEGGAEHRVRAMSEIPSPQPCPSGRGSILHFTGLIASPDASRHKTVQISGPMGDAERLGIKAGCQLQDFLR